MATVSSTATGTDRCAGSRLSPTAAANAAIWDFRRHSFLVMDVSFTKGIRTLEFARHSRY
jgi:hypothetical protein